MHSARKRFRSDDVLKIAEAGLFGPEERMELIDGELFEMTPVGARRITSVNRATAFFTLRRDDSISPLAFPDATFLVDDLIGPKPASGLRNSAD